MHAINLKWRFNLFFFFHDEKHIYNKNKVLFSAMHTEHILPMIKQPKNGTKCEKKLST